MSDRTFGWVQDPGRLSSLRMVVELFDQRSATHAILLSDLIPRLVHDQGTKERLLAALQNDELRMTYRDLVGTHATPRSASPCDGIIQAVVPGQRREYIGDWPADNFLRWAHALSFVSYDDETDTFAITPQGMMLCETDVGSDEEYKIFAEALLSYPPASRILQLLIDSADRGDVMTKFDIGRNLGFIGEEGFTSISQTIFVKELAVAPQNERAKIRSNWEGDADKYARMICAWLRQLKYPWVELVYKNVEVKIGEAKYSERLRAYTVSRQGIQEYRQAQGKSCHARVAKFVPVEMLSTKGKDRAYLRTRRAYIILALHKERSEKELIAFLNEKGFILDEATLRDDLHGLANIGLSIVLDGRGLVWCEDRIGGLRAPAFGVQETRRSDVLELVEKCRTKLSCLPHDFLVLIEMGFDRKASMLFEAKTIELLTEHCKFDGLHLGGANRPDGIIWHEDTGVIIDTKAYGDGFNISATERDKMQRYIMENQTRNVSHNSTKWWELFPADMNKFNFMFVSGRFGGDYREQLRILRERSGVLGNAVSAYELLLLADGICSGSSTKEVSRLLSEPL